MKIVEYLIKLFVEEHLTEICFLIIFSLGVNILTTNVITYFNSTLINAVQQGLLLDTIQNFKYFIYSRVFTAIFQLAYKLIQDVVMTDLKQWSRYQLIKTVFQTKPFKHIWASALPKSYESHWFFNIPVKSGRAGHSRAHVEVIQHQSRAC